MLLFLDYECPDSRVYLNLNFEMQNALRKGAQDALNRGLLSSAQWAAEQLSSCSGDTAFIQELHTNEYLLALCYFNSREYHRCSAKITALDPKSVFLKYYSKYLTFEEDNNRLFRDEAAICTEKHRLSTVSQDGLTDIADYLCKYQEQDGFIAYLLGLTYKLLGRKDDAMQSFIKSVQLYSFHWGAWIEIAKLMERPEEVHKILAKVPDGFMAVCFQIHALIELGQAAEDVVGLIESLQIDSTFLLLQRAVLYHNSRGFRHSNFRFRRIRSTVCTASGTRSVQCGRNGCLLECALRQGKTRGVV